MGIADSYRGFVRNMLRGNAYHILGSIGAKPKEAVDWLAEYLMRQQFDNREAALTEACEKLCPDCPGDDHEGCPAAPVREILAHDAQAKGHVTRLFKEGEPKGAEHG